MRVQMNMVVVQFLQDRLHQCDKFRFCRNRSNLGPVDLSDLIPVRPLFVKISIVRPERFPQKIEVLFILF